MASTELQLVNIACLLVGIKKLDNLTDDRKSIRLANEAYDEARDEIFELPYDWKFATTRAELTILYRLTLNAAPSTEWAVGGTITGDTSGETCVIRSIESTKIFLVDTLSGDFTDGEDLTSATYTATGAADYPVVAALAPLSGYDYQCVLPSACRRLIAVVNEEGDDVQYSWREELLVDAAGTELHVLLTDESSDIFIKYIRLIETVSFWRSWFAKLVYINLALMLCESMKQDKLKEHQLEVKFKKALKEAIEANGLVDTDASDLGVPWDEGNTDVNSAGLNNVAVDRNRYRSVHDI
jgi:hypothetical protein